LTVTQDAQPNTPSHRLISTETLAADSAGAPHQRVLIVDTSEESREVLRTVLERRGVECYEASEGRLGLELAQLHHPQVIVLDEESVLPEDQTTRSGFAASSQDASVVLLATARRNAEEWTPGSVVSKPYHYAALVHTIERLLNRSADSEQRVSEPPVSGGAAAKAAA